MAHARERALNHLPEMGTAFVVDTSSLLRFVPSS